LRPAFEEPDTQAIFQQLNLLADRAGRNAEFDGGGGKTPAPGRGFKKLLVRGASVGDESVS